MGCKGAAHLWGEGGLWGGRRPWARWREERLLKTMTVVCMGCLTYIRINHRGSSRR